MEVQVRGNLNRALRDLKQRLEAEGWYDGLARHESYLKPGERRKRKRHRAEVRRFKRAQRLAR